MAVRQVIQVEEIGTMSIPLTNDRKIELQNMDLALEYD